MPLINRRHLLASPLALTAGSALPVRAEAAPPLASPFDLRWQDGLIVSLKRRHDAFETNYIAPDQALGHVLLTFRRPGGQWQSVNTEALTANSDRTATTRTYDIADEGHAVLRLQVKLAPKGRQLFWSLSLHNLGDQPLDIGDLALPLPMHTQFLQDQPATAAVLKHSFVSGAGSFLFWMRSNSVGPYLLMLPERGTHLEYWQRQPLHAKSPATYCAYIHSATAGETVREKGGRWRQPHTQLTLAPRGQAGADKRYGFRLSWARDYSDVRRQIATAGLIDVTIAPGMTVPTDLSTLIALRSTAPIHGLEAEYPGDTRIESLGLRDGRHIYRVSFARLGENRLTITHGTDQTTYLEFFATEPVETLIRKRGAFIASHQHRDPAKWYNGLLAEWNMETKTLLGPDHYDRIKGWRIYEVTCDDPGLSKPAYLASKNAEYPVQAEIEALDYYVEHFVWGGLQRTTDETYSYGIYGIPDWKQNRDSADPGPKGQTHIWRAYDYPHLIVMYFGLYRIARDHSHLTTRLSAEAYLQRAAGTALAMYTVPIATGDWSAYETGYYNEIVIPELIDALDQAGLKDQAQTLRDHWERKVRYFINDNPNLFGSEYAFDSTGFESTQALARYAIDHRPKGIDPARTQRFLETQMAANLFCRGVIEPAYYTLGSDYRAEGGDSFTLTYMSQMGGSAVMDYALHDAAKPAPYIRLGYASYLSAWAVINSGTPTSNYGYWYPGVENDGASGGGFEPGSYGETWLGQPHHRGIWYYSCESDLGFCGALRMAATILADDPVFGRICYGGDWHATQGGMAIVPKDGVRRRVHARLSQLAISMELTRDRFQAGEAITLASDLSEIRFSLESDNPQAHETMMTISGLRPGAYMLTDSAGARSVTVTVGRQRLVMRVAGGSGPSKVTLLRT